jgi:hypothetical protein
MTVLSFFGFGADLGMFEKFALPRPSLRFSAEEGFAETFLDGAGAFSFYSFFTGAGDDSMY